jgi:hypothetical protein
MVGAVHDISFSGLSGDAFMIKVRDIPQKNQRSRLHPLRWDWGWKYAMSFIFQHFLAFSIRRFVFSIMGSRLITSGGKKFI